jgi:cytochrome c oxidase subunit 2
MNRYMVTLIALICTSAPIMGFGSDTSDAARGQTHYSTCQTCHGLNAEGNQAVGAPRLVGLQEWYLAKQLQKYRSGLRGSEAQDTFGQQMAAIAKVLPNEKAINDVAGYIVTLKANPSTRTETSGDPVKGEALFWHCTHCHGSSGQGINEGYNRSPKSLHPPAPKLSGQDDWYMISQLQNFKSRIRGSHKQDKEGTQCRVRGMSSLSSEKDIYDVVAYIKTLQ